MDHLITVVSARCQHLNLTQHWKSQKFTLTGGAITIITKVCKTSTRTLFTASQLAFAMRTVLTEDWDKFRQKVTLLSPSLLKSHHKRPVMLTLKWLKHHRSKDRLVQVQPTSRWRIQVHQLLQKFRGTKTVGTNLVQRSRFTTKSNYIGSKLRHQKHMKQLQAPDPAKSKQLQRRRLLKLKNDQNLSYNHTRSAFNITMANPIILPPWDNQNTWWTLRARLKTTFYFSKTCSEISQTSNFSTRNPRFITSINNFKSLKPKKP